MKPPDSPPIDIDTSLLIVVGAHLRAEVADRPLGERLRQRILDWQSETGCDAPLVPIICTDLWWLNDRDLQAQPTIAIGNPSVNAASAYFANRLPSALVVENSFEVQVDPELVCLQACLWGVDASATASAVEAFIERYLDPLLRAAHGWAPA